MGKPETQFRINLVLKAKKVKFDTPGATYAIQNNKARGKFLNVYGASYDNGGKIILWDNPQMPETQWHIKSIGGGKYNIINVKSKRCINVAGAGHHNGADIHQWDNPNAPETQFRIVQVGEAYTIQAVHSGKYLNVAGASRDNGAKIHQWDNPGKPETQFRIHLVLKAKKVKFKNPHHRFTIENNKARGKFLNVYGASYDNGAKIILWDNPQMPETQWHIKSVGGGKYNII